jgi:hypothetical protein
MIGVMSAPPPMPVKPMRNPMMRPMREKRKSMMAA